MTIRRNIVGTDRHLQIDLDLSKRCNRSLSSAAGTKKLNVVIVDSYAPESRDGFRDFGLPLAGELYSDMLKKVSPRGVDVETTVIYR